MKAACINLTDRRPRLLLPTRYTARQLVKAAAWFRANPDGVGQMSDYFGHDLTAPQWWAWFRGRLMAKINAADPRFPAGRKASQEYATELDRLRPYIGTRLVLRWVAPILGPRVRAALAHRFPDE